MTYSSAFARDIFISYCHTDNENPLGPGWIEVFQKILSIRMKQILGARAPQEEPSIWRDVRLQGNEAFASTLGDELHNVALIISIMSPSYVRSEWCEREVTEFCRAAQERGGLTVGNKTRIFKVLKTPVDRDQHPPVLQSQIGYEFFTLDNDTKIPKEFTLTPGDSNGARALEVINDLAYHIKATLDAINQATDATRAGAAVSPATAGTRRSVFLAETSFQLDAERGQVRRDLEARGIRVLPEGDLPVRHPQQFRQAIIEALELCDLSVHMVAPDRSLVLTGERHDTVFLQNQLAAERCTRSTLTRLIWMPEGMTPREDDALQREFVEMLHSNPKAQMNAELLTNPVQTLIARIHDTLRKLDEPKTRGVASADVAVPAGRSVVYLIAHPDDLPIADSLRSHLFDSGCEVLEALTDPDATEKEIFETHKMNLIDCDAIVLCFGTAGEFWMRSQLSDAQKAIGWRGGKPLKTRAIYLAPPETPPKTRLRTHDYLVLDGRAGFDPTRLEPLLAALGAAPQGGL